MVTLNVAAARVDSATASRIAALIVDGDAASVR